MVLGFGHTGMTTHEEAMPLIQTDDGCPINIEVEGPANAPVLMLCNSLGTDLHMWDEQAADWSKHFRLVRYDRRGHGQSGAPKGPYTMDMLGRDALAVADAAGAKKFNWCGLSMGGMVGQWMGANARDRVEQAGALQHALLLRRQAALERPHQVRARQRA